MTDPAETAKLLTPFAHIEGKPVLASWMGGDAVRPGRVVLQQAGLPTFDTPEAVIRAFLHMVRYYGLRTVACRSSKWDSEMKKLLLASVLAIDCL